MILKPLTIDGQTIHVQITKEEAKERYLNKDELIFTDDSEKQAFIESLTTHDEAKDPLQEEQPKSSKMNRLMRIMPFLDDEDIHDLLDKVISDDHATSDIDLMMVMPFLNQEDTDRLFEKVLKENHSKINLVAVAPFVSEASLSLVVDLYIEGKIQSKDMDELYPFLSSKDVKRLFEHVLENE
ncbi:hypothetical protein BK010_07375 [Tenericutes bacterium MO-XQ]|nr:hypothetical protein BK010_07375 [Tenericutes bacterium MO-XQ]